MCFIRGQIFEFCNAKNGDNLVSFSEVDLNIETRQNILDFVWLKNKYFSTNDHFQDLFNHDYLAKLSPPPIKPGVFHALHA